MSRILARGIPYIAVHNASDLPIFAAKIIGHFMASNDDDVKVRTRYDEGIGSVAPGTTRTWDSHISRREPAWAKFTGANDATWWRSSEGVLTADAAEAERQMEGAAVQQELSANPRTAQRAATRERAADGHPDVLMT